MGVLKGSLITLKNGNRKKIEDISRRDIIKSCEIHGITPMASNTVTMTWSQENPIIIDDSTQTTHKWKEDIYNYRIINNKLKISYDTLVLFKDDNNVTSWGYSKSLRKGYFLFNDKYEYEEIKSNKTVKENSESICLSVYPNSYYFVDGYLIHNVYLCDACDTCKLLPTLWQWYGPHKYNSTALLVSNTYHNNTQQQQYTSEVTLYAKRWFALGATSFGSWGFASIAGGLPRTTSTIVAWNIFPGKLTLNVGSSSSSGSSAYYVTKYWDKNEGNLPTSSNNSNMNKGPGWISYKGRVSDTGSSSLGRALEKLQDLIADGYGVPTDPWYHGGYAGLGNLNVKARLIHSGVAGTTAWVTTDGGTTYTEITSAAYNSTSAGTGAADGYIEINEDTMGGQGNSKIFIIYKFPMPSSGNTIYTLKWHLSSHPLYSFTEHTFTNCKKTGREGPTLGECRSFYGFGISNLPLTTGPWWQNNDYFYVHHGVQCWKCPFTGVYEVTGLGAAGGDSYTKLGGHGARISARFSLVGGDWYWILVGQKGSGTTNYTYRFSGGGGGGGTFFVKMPPSLSMGGQTGGAITHNLTVNSYLNSIDKDEHLLLAAGGGGGAHANAPEPSPNGEGGWWDQNTTNNWLSRNYVASDSVTSHGGASGTSGSATFGYAAGGGGGFDADGNTSIASHNHGPSHGLGFVNNAPGRGGQGYAAGSSTGPNGSYILAHGGFGGGGAGDYHAPGGGGGSYGGDAAIPWDSGAEGGGTVVRHYYGDASADGETYIGNNVTKGNTSDLFSGGHGSLTIKYLASDLSPSYLIPHDEATAYSFSSHTFTNCGATGRTSHTTAAAFKNAYGSTGFWQDSANFGITEDGWQWWKVPGTGLYDIDVYGAQGGSGGSGAGNDAVGGKGARIESRFVLIKGEYLWIVVGQQGGVSSTGGQTYWGGGGGGGSFVIKTPTNATGIHNIASLTAKHLLIAAGGGGGGSGTHIYADGGDGNATSTGSPTAAFSGGAIGSNYYAGGGAGFLGDGGGGTNASTSIGGQSAISSQHFEGGIRGNYNGSAADGGFGGGGGGSAHSPGGGGGAWGGDGGGLYSASTGGISYSASSISTPTSVSGSREGHGQIIISAVNSFTEGEKTNQAGGYLGDTSIDPNGWFSATAFNS